MNRESFLDTIRQQYADDILEIWKECRHDGQVDVQKLDEFLFKLLKSAKQDGLNTGDFQALVRAVLPDCRWVASEKKSA